MTTRAATRDSTRSTRRRTAPRSTGSTRAPTRAATRTTTSTPCASSRWSRPRTASTAPRPVASSTVTPRSGCASSARFPCASPKREAGLRYEKEIKNVEYFRDIKSILDRSCVACHTEKHGKPAFNFGLDDDRGIDVSYVGKLPGTYVRLAHDQQAKYGNKPVIHNGTWRQTNASRYVRMFQSRRSLLTWKIYGRRTDGWDNEDFPHETIAGD